MFVCHLEATHSKDPQQAPCSHTIVVKANSVKWKKTGSRRDYVEFNQLAKDLLYAGCLDNHVSVQQSRRIDPLLKLYGGCPVMLNQNNDVEKCEANRARCTFVKAKLSVSISQLDIIIIEGYYVYCVCVSQVNTLVLRNEDAPT